MIPMRDLLLHKIWFDHRTQWSFHFSCYLLIVWLIHLAMISVVAFFHFQLGYNLSNIEDWVSFNAWEILVLTKLVAFWTYFRFLTIRIDSRFPVRLMLQRGVVPLKFELLMPLVFILFFVLVNGMPHFGDLVLVSWLKVLWNYLGIVFFFGADIFIFIALQEVYPLTKRERTYQDFTCALLLLIASFGIFPYLQGPRGILFLTLYLTCYFTHFKDEGKNWTLPLCYLLVVAAPLGALFGVDSVWDGRFAPLEMTHELGLASLIVLILGLNLFPRWRILQR